MPIILGPQRQRDFFSALANSRTLYMHFGQNMLEECGNGKAYVTLWKNTNNVNFNWVYKDNSDVNGGWYHNEGQKEMTLVEGLSANDHLFKYEMSEEELIGVTDITFWYWMKDSSEKGMYRAGAVSEKSGWDKDNMCKYIYYVYSIDNNGVAEQSYVTIDDYMSERSNKHDVIYLVGTGFNEFSPEWDIANVNMMKADATMGVFYPEFTWSDKLATVDFTGTKKTGARFKMSWLKPAQWHSKYYKTAINNNRAWVTFNLGIIGYDKETVDNNTTLKQHLSVIFGSDGSERCVPINDSKTMPINNHNQSNWFLEKTNNADMTLVVDLDGHCESVTMLPFSPQPGVTAKDIQITSYTNSQAAAHRTAPSLLAETANGPVLFHNVNVATALGEIKGISTANLNQCGYDLTYEFYADGLSIGTYKHPKNGKDNPTLHFKAIPVGQDVKIGVRALFKDVQTQMTFHSKYFEEAIGGEAQLAAPGLSITNAAYTNGSNNLTEVVNGKTVNITDNSKDPHYMLGAKATAVVTAPDNRAFPNIAWYGDFNSGVSNGSWEDSYHSVKPELADGGMLEGANPWTEANFNGYNHQTHNWAADLGNTTVSDPKGEWTIALTDVVKVQRVFADDFEHEWDFSEVGFPEKPMVIDLSIAAVYPFLVDQNAEVTLVEDNKSNAPRRAAATNLSAYDFIAGHNYSIVPVRREAADTYELTSEHLTGINDVINSGNGAADIDAPVEYYNLQGMRMNPDNLTPGIYIRRQGTKTEKMIIR